MARSFLHRTPIAGIGHLSIIIISYEIINQSCNPNRFTIWTHLDYWYLWRYRRLSGFVIICITALSINVIINPIFDPFCPFTFYCERFFVRDTHLSLCLFVRSPANRNQIPALAILYPLTLFNVTCQIRQGLECSTDKSTISLFLSDCYRHSSLSRKDLLL